MTKEPAIDVTGVVKEILPNAQYRVELDGGHIVLAYAAGKLKKFKIRILVGDKVKLELSPYDLTRGRLCWREK